MISKVKMNCDLDNDLLEEKLLLLLLSKNHKLRRAQRAFEPMKLKYIEIKNVFENT